MPSFVASMTPIHGAVNPTSGNWTLPAGWQVGDVAVFWWAANNNGKTFTEPAEVTQKHDFSTATATEGRLFLGYRWLESGDSVFGWTASSLAGVACTWGVDVFRDVGTSGDPFGAEAT